MASTDTEKRGWFKRKPHKDKKPGRLSQFKQVYRLAHDHNKLITLLIIGSILAGTGLGIGVGFLVPPLWLWIILGTMSGTLLGIFIMGKFAEAGAFSQMRGKQGAIGAVMKTARRSWLMDEQPIAIDPRTQSIVYRSTGKGGVILISEGSPGACAKLLNKEKKRHERVLPNVPVHTFQGGEGKHQIPMNKIVKTIHTVPKNLKKAEVLAIRKRLTALGTATGQPPIPKGVDPHRMRPDRKAMRGR